MNEVVTPRRDLFLCSRTSAHDLDVKPFDGCVKRLVVRVDRRNTNDPAKVPAYLGRSEWWHESGTNHRIENGKICRDIGVMERWVIYSPNIIALVEEHGEVIVGKDQDGFYTIEIYDDYRE